MRKFVKKPVVVEAYQFDGNIRSIDNFPISEVGKFKVSSENGQYYLIIPTLEGDMKAVAGDWIIKGVKGEYYPCKPDIFKNSYDKVNPSFITEGQKRVRLSFNPSALTRVEDFKKTMAKAIDLLVEEAELVKVSLYDMGEKEYNSLNSDFQREIATAKTQIQQASMWGVLALTSSITFKKDTILKEKENE